MTTLMQTVNTIVDGKIIRIHAETLPLPETDLKIENTHAVSYIVDTLKIQQRKLISALLAH